LRAGESQPVRVPRRRSLRRGHWRLPAARFVPASSLNQRVSSKGRSVAPRAWSPAPEEVRYSPKSEPGKSEPEAPARVTRSEPEPCALASSRPVYPAPNNLAKQHARWDWLRGAATDPRSRVGLGLGACRRASQDGNRQRDSGRRRSVTLLRAPTCGRG
jgi:hypothetical protein